VPKNVDSLSEAELKKLKSSVGVLTHKIDSLHAKGLPTHSYQKRLDSIQNKLRSHLSVASISDPLNASTKKAHDKISAQKDSVEKKVNQRAESLRRKIDQKKSVLDSSGIKIKAPVGQLLLHQKNIPNVPAAQLPSINGRASIPNVNTSLPSANTGTNLPSGKINLPGVKEISQVSNEVKQVENTASKEIATVSKETIEIKKEAGELKTLNTKVAEAKKEVKDAVTDKEKIKELEKEAAKNAEQQATQVKELNILKQKNPLEEYKDMLGSFKKETGVREIKDVSAKALTNPFLGQEAKLQAGMAELEKLKQKYGEVNEHTFPLKKIYNSLKGKPFKDRFIPALGFQALDGHSVGIDFMPYFMYRYSGRIRVGVGFDYRMMRDQQTFLSSAHVVGFRALADVRVYKSWYFHIEGEWLHFDQQGARPFYSDPTTREWNDRLNIGILRTYKISRRLNGMYEALYYAGDWRLFPQAKYGAIRFGLEYKLGIKKPRHAIK
jgi:hypothetical protein